MTLYILTKISVEAIISMDPDQNVLQEESDQGLHCLSKRNKALREDWHVVSKYMKVTHKTYADS